MPLINSGPLALTLIASLSVAVVLLVLRITVMQRIQRKRQRENRQETERLKSLVAAYRSLAGSFSPANSGDTSQIEETLSDVVLFGSLRQVELASRCIGAIKRGELPDCQFLIEELRADIRVQLGLDRIPPDLHLPPSGPGRQSRHERGERDGSSRGSGNRGGGGGGGGGSAAIGAGGLGAGLMASDSAEVREGE